MLCSALLSVPSLLLSHPFSSSFSFFPLLPPFSLLCPPLSLITCRILKASFKGRGSGREESEKGRERE
jgi:hypothetical protein